MKGFCGLIIFNGSGIIVSNGDGLLVVRDDGVVLIYGGEKKDVLLCWERFFDWLDRGYFF